MSDGAIGFFAGHCDGCGTDREPLLKLSMGKDFFGRPYDRLSPLSDQSPKWYCATCSLQKNLQRDFRDIKAEFDKFSSGQPSEFARPDQLQRAQLRLREIMAILAGHSGGSRLIDTADVIGLLQKVRAESTPPSSAG